MSYREILNYACDPAVREQASVYFENYWLDQDEYFDKWVNIQNSIFDRRASHLPYMIFNDGYELFPLVGGNIFISEQDLKCLQYCMRQTGDSNFVVIQNPNLVIKETAVTRFKYKSDVSWQELFSGGILGSEHLQTVDKDYFVFGESGTWGRYVANSWIVPGRSIGNPINIMGFKGEFADLFRNKFEEVRLSEPEITPEILLAEWLPEGYRERVN